MNHPTESPSPSPLRKSLEKLAREAAEVLQRCAILSFPDHQNGKHQASEIILTALRLAVDQQYLQPVDTSARDILDRVAEEHACALRSICLLFGFDPSDGEGTTGDEVYQMVKARLAQQQEDTRMLDWLEANGDKVQSCTWKNSGVRCWDFQQDGSQTIGECKVPLRAAIASAMSKEKI